jgi:acetoin utilization deacetylase AcuC-like enzyme
MTGRAAVEIGVFTAARCLEHRVPAGFPERPDRLARIVDRLRRNGWSPCDVASGAADWRAAVLAVHDAEYVERFHRAVERGDGLLDSADNPLSPGTWTAAVAAVETTVAACDWSMAGVRRCAFAAVRPPGHHAERDLAMGFCYFNHAAIAAERLRQRHGVEKVAILDFDVHHGNGTQHLFEDRADVLYVSTHQYPFYPGTGAAEERGRGAGFGATVNVPLPAGSDDLVYRRAFEDIVAPAIEAYRGGALVISAGFDAFAFDPLGGMRVTAEGFREWGAQIAQLADELCEGRSLSLLEGGYDLEALPELVEAYLTGLSGKSAQEIKG